VLDDGFETYTLPADDADPTNSGDGNAMNWRVSEQRPDNVRVVRGMSTHGKGDNRQVLHIQTDDGEAVGLSRNFAAQPIGQPIRLTQSFKIRCNDISLPADCRFNLYGEGGMPFYIRFTPSSRGGRSSSDGISLIAGSDDSERPDQLVRRSIVPDIEQGQWYRVTLVIHMRDRTWDILVENLDSDAQAQRGEALGLQFWQHPVVLHQFMMAGVSSDRPAANFDLDDIITRVEPDDSPTR
jgi:hypothetical protein